MKLALTIFFLLTLVCCQSTTMRQNTAEFSERARPNDIEISYSQAGYSKKIKRWKSQNRLYIIKPKGNADEFRYEHNKKSLILEKELSEGYILSYLFYENGVIKYNGKAKDGRFKKNTDRQGLRSCCYEQFQCRNERSHGLFK